jgi:hypothetical protein
MFEEEIMKADFNNEGYLVIMAETPTERYALSKYTEDIGYEHRVIFDWSLEDLNAEKDER